VKGLVNGTLLGVERVIRSPGSFPTLLGPVLGAGGPRVRRVGLVTNDGSSPGRGALLQAGINLTRLFSPEHGLTSAVPDGTAVEDGTDPLTGLPVTSLYGAGLAPAPEILSELDVVLFDLQDVGARFYTFLWTLLHVMEACSEARVPLWVLDRPNPLGGMEAWVEGPLPDPGLPETFLCRWPVPVRHSLTLGEMALLFREEKGLETDLRVVPMAGWRRSLLWPETGRRFVPPSPGIVSFHAALLYPGLALLEATNVEEGRGTPLAFQWFGAPWMDAEGVARAVSGVGIAGVRARPLELGQGSPPSPGVHLQVTEPGAVRPVRLGLHILSVLAALHPGDFRWTPYPTMVNPEGRHHLLRLTGSRSLVDALKGISGTLDREKLSDLTRAPGWWERVSPYLLYP
jgi:uncharacterized protein YbbC (DUF1343 family)